MQHGFLCFCGLKSNVHIVHHVKYAQSAAVNPGRHGKEGMASNSSKIAKFEYQAVNKPQLILMEIRGDRLPLCYGNNVHDK